MDRSKPRRLRFGLRSLLIMVLIAGPLAAWAYLNWPVDIYEDVKYETFIGIGVIEPSQSRHVADLLDSHRIPNIIEGSVAYGVSVPPDHAIQATQILKTDAAANNYWFEANERK